MIVDSKEIIAELSKLQPPPEAAYIKTPAQAIDGVIAHFHDESLNTQGYPVMFPEFSELIRFRAGEVSLWGGENHTGKSEMLNQFILSMLGEARCFLMSPEMPLSRTLAYLTTQATCEAVPSKEKITNFLTKYNDDLYLLDQSSTMKPDMILKLIRYVVEMYGVKHCAIDSLMKCGIKLDDHNMQHWFIDQLCVLAKSLEIHIHVVAHHRKPSKGERPNRYMIRGSSSIPDLADNCLICWRNFDKEDALSEGTTDEQYTELMEEPDSKLIIDKQRNGTGWRGFIKLWHKPEARTFVTGRWATLQPTN